ncbi:hypothetical protein MUS1_01770 [Marinomonas ushuaiensis DSM 15871]|uniref:Uncharacterized protein n=1 Tax=Marinomonas ushuaiensis DSM 15871 TaxID=1122207 RepID=X7EC25_9GAMM|nr:hypothetical protein [Marinomonas ushuaiensis]ETX12683.1 hypothetical protein MUS1_01770 [Marinomonas ushuaiensis DSM 15871]
MTLPKAHVLLQKHNDLPLLDKVHFPIAIDPDPILRKQHKIKVGLLSAYARQQHTLNKN